MSRGNYRGFTGTQVGVIVLVISEGQNYGGIRESDSGWVPRDYIPSLTSYVTPVLFVKKRKSLSTNKQERGQNCISSDRFLKYVKYTVPPRLLPTFTRDFTGGRTGLYHRSTVFSGRGFSTQGPQHNSIT